MIPFKRDEPVSVTLRSGHTISGTITDLSDDVVMIDSGDAFAAETTFVDRHEVAAIVYKGHTGWLW